jgi:hypothetical protein
MAAKDFITWGSKALDMRSGYCPPNRSHVACLIPKTVANTSPSHPWSLVNGVGRRPPQ